VSVQLLLGLDGVVLRRVLDKSVRRRRLSSSLCRRSFGVQSATACTAASAAAATVTLPPGNDDARFLDRADLGEQLFQVVPPDKLRRRDEPNEDGVLRRLGHDRSIRRRRRRLRLRLGRPRRGHCCYCNYLPFSLVLGSAVFLFAAIARLLLAGCWLASASAAVFLDLFFFVFFGWS